MPSALIAEDEPMLRAQLKARLAEAWPELTTIAQPVMEIGQRVIDLLLKQINDPASAPEVVVLEPTLIERESCRAVRSP